MHASGGGSDVYEFKIIGGRKRRVPINRWDTETRPLVAAGTVEVQIHNDLSELSRYWAEPSCEPVAFHETADGDCGRAHDGRQSLSPHLTAAGQPRSSPQRAALSK